MSAPENSLSEKKPVDRNLIRMYSSIMNTTTLLVSRPLVENDAAVVGVRTTGIYCRPECRPGRSPRPENCLRFPDAAAARAAGYRACKKCRPDDGPAETIQYGQASTPIGNVFGAISDKGLCALYLLDHLGEEPAIGRLRHDFPKARLGEGGNEIAVILERAVAHVLNGDPVDDIALDLRGTAFQQQVWEALRTIRRGTTTTYGKLTRTLGLAPGTARAVGSACGSNRVSLIVPCHRVLASGRGLGGYYWGLERKQAFLEAEGCVIGR